MLMHLQPWDGDARDADCRRGCTIAEEVLLRESLLHLRAVDRILRQITLHARGTPMEYPAIIAHEIARNFLIPIPVHDITLLVSIGTLLPLALKVIAMFLCSWRQWWCQDSNLQRILCDCMSVHPKQGGSTSQ